MTDQNQTAAPAAPASNPNVASTAASQAAATQDPRVQKASQEPVTSGAGKQAASSTLISNPPPAVDPDAPAAEPKVDQSRLPQSTIDEMNAGRKALERNKPVAQALEAARDAKPEAAK